MRGLPVVAKEEAALSVHGHHERMRVAVVHLGQAGDVDRGCVGAFAQYGDAGREPAAVAAGGAGAVREQVVVGAVAVRAESVVHAERAVVRQGEALDGHDLALVWIEHAVGRHRDQPARGDAGREEVGVGGESRADFLQRGAERRVGPDEAAVVAEHDEVDIEVATACRAGRLDDDVGAEHARVGDRGIGARDTVRILHVIVEVARVGRARTRPGHARAECRVRNQPDVAAPALERRGHEADRDEVAAGEPQDAAREIVVGVGAGEPVLDWDAAVEARIGADVFGASTAGRKPEQHQGSRQDRGLRHR